MDLLTTLGKALKPETLIKKDFKVVAVSENTNSFGLRQMIMVAKDKTVFKGCFNYLNEKKQGDTITATVILNEEAKEISTSFIGGELVEKLANVPQEAVNEIWK